MIFKVKRLSMYEDLLLEADIIKIGNDIDDFSKYSEKEKQDAFDKIDNMIDDLIDKNIDEYLRNPNFINAFTADKVLGSISAYIEYSKLRVSTLKARVENLINASVYSSEEIRLINITVAKIQARLEILDKIYRAAKLEKTNQLIELINAAQSDIREYYLSPMKIKAEKVKQAVDIIKTTSAPTAKYQAAEAIYIDFEEVSEISKEYPDEIKAGVAQAQEKIEEEISKEFSEEELTSIKTKKVTSIFFTKIVKDILEFEQLYAPEAEIKETARLLRNVRIANNDSLDSDSKIYLTSWVDQVEITLLKRAQDKSLKLELNKGVNYKFNINLPLFKTVMLPVTGKQIADNTFIAKAKQKFIEISKVLFGDTESPKTDLGRAMYDLGASFSRVYSVALNRTAKMIGRAVSGREGEIKADAVSRMFMPTTEYLDKIDKVAEESVAPGVTMQVPASIGGMGPITPPTRDSFGSGDKFSPKKKKKRIMEFAEFLKNKTTNNATT